MPRRLYQSQYEDDYEYEHPLKNWIVRRNWLLWLLFYAPGSFVLWKEYMFPQRGQVWASQRRAQNKIMIVLYSIGFWLLLPFISLGIYAEVIEPAQQTWKHRRSNQAEDNTNNDNAVLQDLIFRSYRSCWQRADIQRPNGYVPVVRIFFDQEGNITDQAALASVPTNPKLREIAFETLQIVNQCEINIPDNLKYLSRQWHEKTMRFNF